MRKLIWKLLVLAVLVGCFIVIPSPQPAEADIWGECDAQRTERNDNCYEIYDACLWANLKSDAECLSDYNACLDEAARLHHDYTQSPPTGCLFENPEDPVPWPIISHSRSNCLSGCSAGAAQIPDINDRLEYYGACWSYCDANFPKP